MSINANTVLTEKDTLIRFLKYLLSGGSAVVAHYSVLFFLVTSGVDPLIATCIGFTVAIAVNYIGQFYWVFKTSKSHQRTFPVYLAVTVVMGTFNAAIFWFLNTRIGWHYLSSQALGTVTIVILNFVINRRFTFAVVSKDTTQSKKGSHFYRR